MASLKTMLDGMGLDEVKENKNDKGEVVSYSVNIQRAPWTFWISVSLSPDKTNVWLNAWLSKVPDPGNVPPKVLLGLLAANEKIWPAYFIYSETWTQFRLSMPVPNRDVKAKDLRKQLDLTCSMIQEYAPLWNPEKWPKTK
jgi:hypothetical protein